MWVSTAFSQMGNVQGYRHRILSSGCPGKENAGYPKAVSGLRLKCSGVICKVRELELATNPSTSRFLDCLRGAHIYSVPPLQPFSCTCSRFAREFDPLVPQHSFRKFLCCFLCDEASVSFPPSGYSHCRARCRFSRRYMRWP